MNCIDELEPLSIRMQKLNRTGGRVNSSFAVILFNSDTNEYLSDTGDFSALSYHNPPLEKVSKLKVKFRYHNGQLVDFGDKEVILQ